MRSRGRRRIIAEVESIKVQTLVVAGRKEIVPVTFPDDFLTFTPDICAQIAARKILLYCCFRYIEIYKTELLASFSPLGLSGSS